MFTDRTVEQLCSDLALALDAELTAGAAPGTFSSLWAVHGLDLDTSSGLEVRLLAAFDTHPTSELFGYRCLDPEVLGLVLASAATATDDAATFDARVLYLLLRDGTELVLLHRAGHVAEITVPDTARPDLVSGRVAATLRRCLALPSRATESVPLPTPQELHLRTGLTLTLMLHEILGPEDADALPGGLEALLAAAPAATWSEEHDRRLRELDAALAHPSLHASQRVVLERRRSELEWLDPCLFALFSHENAPSSDELRAELARRVEEGSLPAPLARRLAELAHLPPL